MDAGLHEVRGNDRGGAADASGGVHAEHRLADGTERLRKVQLGHHHAFEHVRRLAEHDRVDIGPRHLCVFERAHRGLAHEARDRHVVALRVVLRLADADDRCR